MPMKPITHEDFTIETVRRLFDDTEFYVEALRYFAGGGVLFGVEGKNYTYPDGYVKLEEDKRLAIALTKFARHAWRFVERYALYNMFDVAHNEDGNPFVLTIQNILDGIGMLEKSSLFPSKALETMNTITQEYVKRFPSAVGSFDKYVHCFGVTSRVTHKNVLGTFLWDFLTRFMTGDEALHEKGKKVFQKKFGLSKKDLLFEVPVPFIPTFKSMRVEGMLRFKPQHPLVVNSVNQHTSVTEERKMYTTPYSRSHNCVLQAAFSYDEANALLNKQAAFVRPCPMHPRHGFLESRPIGVEYLQLYSMMSLLSPIHSYYYAAGELDDMLIMTADFVNSVNYALLTRYAIHDVAKFTKGKFAIEDFPFWRGAFGSHTFGSTLSDMVNSAYTDGVTAKSVQEAMNRALQDIDEEYISDLKHFLHETALHFEYEEDNTEFEAMWTDFFHTKSKYVSDVLRRLIIADFLMGCLTFIVAFSEGDVVEWVDNLINELRTFETLEDEFEQVEEPFNLLIMPKLEGRYSGIVSLQDGVIEFAFGSNEGITAGNAEKYYGVNLVPEEGKPFMLEFVDGYVVQKRKVPKKSRNAQHRQVEVKKVLDVRPFKEFNDALGWERLIREHADAEGVVAFCEKLPRTSHFTTQCLEWGIPVVFGDEPPKVGKVVEFHYSREVSQEFLRRIRLGVLPKLIEEEKTLKEMYMFDLVPLHATSFLGRNEDEAYAEFEARLFSHALTRLVLGGAYAVAREARHAVSAYTYEVSTLLCHVKHRVVSKNIGDISRLIKLLSKDDEIDRLLFVGELAGHSYSIVDTLLRDVPERFRSPLFQKVLHWFEDFEMEFSGPSNRFDLHIEMFKLFNSLNVIGVSVSSNGADTFLKTNAFEKEGRVCLDFYRSHSIEQLQRLTAVSVVLNAIYYRGEEDSSAYCGERWMDFGANILAILTLLEVQPEKRDTEWWRRMVSLVHRALNAVHNGNASPVEKMISSYEENKLNAAENWTVADFLQPLFNLLKKCDGEDALGFQEADGAISRQASEKIEAELNNEVGKDLSSRIVKTICPVEYTSMGNLWGRVKRVFGNESGYGDKFHALAEFECGVEGCEEVTKTFGFVHPMASYLLGKPIWTYPIFYYYSCTGFYPLVVLLLNSGMTFMRHFVWGEVYSSYSIYNCKPFSVMSYPEIAPLCDKHRGELFDIQKKAFEKVEQLQYQYRERVVEILKDALEHYDDDDENHCFSKMKAVFDYYRKCHGDFCEILLDEEDREAFKEILPTREIETFIRELEENYFVQFPKDESLSTLEKVHLLYGRIFTEDFLCAEPSLVENLGALEKKKVELVSTFLKRLRSGRFYNKVGLPKPKWVSSGGGKKLVIGFVEEYEEKGEDA